MTKTTRVLNLTYMEKISTLYSYYIRFKNLEPEKAMLAKDMSTIIYHAIKLSDPMPLEIADDILNSSATIASKPHFLNPPRMAENGVTKILATFKPEIVCFDPPKSAYEKIEILKKYVYHEINKKQSNTCKFC